MKFMIGYQNNDALKKTIFESRDSVAEIYFPWSGFTSGRGMVDSSDSQRQMETDLDDYAGAGIGMNLLLNGNCYGRHSQSRRFFQLAGDTVDQLKKRYQLGSVTTTSPVIARFLHANFSDLEIRASVNMEIGTVEGMDYLSDSFDGFYLKREYNHDLRRIEKIRRWCDDHEKKLYLLVNSGCLNYCSARTFHDNLVAHQHEIAEMDNAFEFGGICHEYLTNAANRKKFLQLVNFIRPEDLSLYEDCFDGFKLATRTNRNPSAVVRAYVTRHFSGNLLDLTEPSHAEHFYPAIAANDRFPSDYGKRILNCNKECESCRWCETVWENALLTLE